MDLSRESIEKLEEQIKFWTNRLKVVHDAVERATLENKIQNAKKEIDRKKLNIEKPEVKTQIDAPALVDRVEGSSSIELSRGQIMNAGDVFAITL